MQKVEKMLASVDESLELKVIHFEACPAAPNGGFGVPFS